LDYRADNADRAPAAGSRPFCGWKKIEIKW